MCSVCAICSYIYSVDILFSQKLLSLPSHHCKISPLSLCLHPSFSTPLSSSLAPSVLRRRGKQEVYWSSCQGLQPRRNLARLPPPRPPTTPQWLAKAPWPRTPPTILTTITTTPAQVPVQWHRRGAPAPVRSRVTWRGPSGWSLCTGSPVPWTPISPGHPRQHVPATL